MMIESVRWDQLIEFIHYFILQKISRGRRDFGMLYVQISHISEFR